MIPMLMALVASGLVLRIETPQSQVLVGEPVKLTVRWRIAGPNGLTVKLQPADFTQHSLAFYVHDGESERLYVEARRGGDTVAALHPMSPGEEFSTNLVLLRGGYAPNMHTPAVPTLLFEQPGSYRLRAEYLGNGTGSLEGAGVSSNTIRIRVTAPKGPDLEILKFSQQNRLVLDATGSSDRQNEETEALIARYPRSPYLLWTRLRLLHFKGADGPGHEDRLAMAALRRSDPLTYERQVRAFYEDLARQVLAYDWGPFEEDALAQAHAFARSAGDDALIRETRERLLAKYPRSTYSRDVREESPE